MMTVKNLLLWLLVTILLLAGCTPIQPVSNEQSLKSATFETPANQDERASFAEDPVPWITDEIILLGANKDIQELLNSERFRSLELEPELVSRFDLTSLITELLEEDERERSEEFFREYLGIPFSLVQERQGQGIGVELYRFRSDTNILEFIEIVDSIRADSIAEGRALLVFAEPNFIFASSQNSPGTCTNQGQPNSFGNGPFGGAVYSTGGISDFNDQWAFQRLANISHTDPPMSDPVGNNTPSANPTPVDVLIFDTSPFTDIDDTTDVTNGISQTIGMGPTQMTLELWHWPFSAPKLNEHGVMVASLIHKIAPNSTIKIVRVLDNLGCGTSYELLEAMSAFLSSFPKNKKGVINLSLAANNAFKQPGTLGLLITVSSSKGLLVVAAAGNGKGQALALPASLVDNPTFPNSNLIAVEASNFHSLQACFTNRGTNSVWAPGGEGSNPSTTCSNNLGNCADEATCDNAIMGRTHDGRFAFWTGTSFAAPLVSGAAARWLSQGCTLTQVYDHLTDMPTGTVVDLTSLSCP